MTRLLLILLLLGGCATKRQIAGQVVDRNGEGLARVNVRLEPGNVEIITDDEGRFLVDYLRDEEGNRIKLKRKSAYTVSLFKVGYHEATSEVNYLRGELVIEPIALTEDTVRVSNSDDDIDPARFTDRAQNAGGSYEGE